jgi:3-oxoacyl-(acyl-carrier-protein) synthase
MKFNLERIKDIVNLTRQLAVGLRDLSFTDNFTSFETTLTVAATTEARIRNELSVKPTRYVVVSQEGNGLITKGTTEWTDNFLYLYNNGAASVTFTVIFFK